MPKKKLYYIYAHLCIITAKIYIGWATNPKRRWNEHCIRKDGTHFHNAIQKYGKEFFEHYIIAYSTNLDEIKQKEKDFIKQFDTCANGYNMAPGGEGNNYWQGKKRPEHSKFMQGKKYAQGSKSLQGYHHTEETKNKMRRAIKGRKHTKEELQKMRISHLGLKRPDQSERMKKNNPMKNSITVLKHRYITLKNKIKNIEC